MRIRLLLVAIAFSILGVSSTLEAQKGDKDKLSKDKDFAKDKSDKIIADGPRPTFKFQLDDVPKFSECKNVDKIAVSPDGLLVAVGVYNSHAIFVWELKSQKPVLGIGGYYDRISFTPDGKKLAAIGSTENRLILWDINAGKELHKFDFPNWKDGGGITMARFLQPSPDGKSFHTIYNGTKHLRLGIADGKGEYLDCDKSLAYETVAYSPKLDWFVAASNRPKQVTLYKLGKNAESKKIEVTDEPAALAISGDGKTMAVSLRGKSIFKSDAENAKFMDHIDIFETAGWKIRGKIPAVESADFRAYESMAITADGKHLAGIRTSVGDKRKPGVELWDTTTGKLLRTVDHGDSPLTVAFTPDGQTMLIGYRIKGLVAENVK
jgi:WD40 repeat protein